MSGTALVLLGEPAPGALDLPAAWQLVELRGEAARGPLATVLARALAQSEADALVVLDATRVRAPHGLAALVAGLAGADAVAARVLTADGARIVFAGGGLDLRAGPQRPGRDAPAALARGAGTTLWFDARAFAITRAAAAQLIALPVDPTLDELAAGWQIWRGGGRIALSDAASVRASMPEPPPADEAGLRVALGALLEPGTLAASGVRLDGVLERVLEARALLGGERARSDAEILAAAGAAPLLGALPQAPPLRTVSRPAGRRALYVLCSDSIGPSMAGPGIRAVELARVLARHFDVTVLARRITGPVDLECELGELRRDVVSAIATGRDPVVLQGPLTDWYPQLLRGTAPVAVDLYDPMNLEALEHPDADTHVPYATRLLVEQVTRGDFFLCASERQRDYWLGMLAACGRVDSVAYRQDPDLRALIDLVPFGLADDAPVRSGPGPREQIAGIGPDDPLFIWNGGLWDWFDPDTLLDAALLARQTVPDLRILFMGIKRPGEAELSPGAAALVQRSETLGLTGETVFFRDWTPYGERHNTYLQATAAVSLHHAHLESRFSFRTRMLDCIWATLPILGTDGDVLADIVRGEQLGLTVRPGDARGVAEALVALAQDRDGVTTLARTQLAAVAPRFRWESAAAPLVAWAERATAHPQAAVELTALAQPAPLTTRLRPLARRLRGAIRARLG